MKLKIEEYNKNIISIQNSFFRDSKDLIKAFYHSKNKRKTEKQLSKELINLTDKDGIYINKTKDIFKFLMSTALGFEISSVNEKELKNKEDKHPIFPILLENDS